MLGGYKQLEWIESAGNGYVITDLVPTRDWGFDIDFITNNTIGTSGYGCILGARVNSGVNDYQLTTYSNAGYGGTLRLGTVATPIVGLVEGERIQCSLRNGVFTRPDGTTVEVHPTGDAPTYPVAVFGINQSSSVVQIGKGRLYSLSMYDGSRWVHYVPAIRVSDSKCGLYNWNDDVFLAATGTITGGAVVAHKYLDNIGLSYFWEKIKNEMRINEKSVSGSLATFSDASSLPAKSLSVSIDAVQSGSGDPSPDNVREITGWDWVNVTVCGKNIYPTENAKASGTNAGITWNRNADGSITFSGTATAQINLSLWQNVNQGRNAFSVKAGTYKISVTGLTSGMHYIIGGAGGTSGLEYVDATATSYSKITRTLSDGTTGYNIIRIDNGATVDTTVYIQWELSDDFTTYEPYKGTVYPISLPQTVYGGVLDVETGTLTVTKAVSVPQLTSGWTKSGESSWWYNFTSKERGTATAICSHFPVTTYTSSDRVQLNNTGFTTLAELGAYQAEQTASGTPITIVYDLATPLTLSLTPTEVRTILGYNNVYADSGEVDVVYYRDSIAASNDGFMSSADKEKLDRLNLPVLQTKEYTGIIGSENNVANATFYFANIVPDDYYKQWKVHYRVTASIPGQNAYNQVSEVTLTGDQSSQRVYRGENSNTGTRAYMYNALYRATLAGCNNGYGHVLGVGLRNATNATSASYPRTFVIELLDCEDCTVTLWDEMKKYASIPGTGSTNYNGLTEDDAYNNGYKQTGDNNTYDRTYVASFNPKAGAGGLKQYGLFMEDSSGTYQSLTTTNGTGTSKTKNTTGFKPGRIWYLNSSSNFASGSSAGASTAYLIMPFDGRYSFNLATTLTAHEPVYLVGTIGTDGLFYLDDTWWTQSLPTTNDGKLYMYVGLAYSTTNVHLAPDHPMYWYKNGAVRLWPDGIEAASSAVSGVKGNAESAYRTGNVNITPANIGAASKITGMAADGSAVSVASGTTYVDIETDITIAANHRYLCNYIVQWTSNATGRRAIKAVMGTTDVGIISQNTCAPANGAATIHGASFWIQPSTSARTMKIQGYQNSGSALTATVRYQLIDFGTA